MVNWNPALPQLVKIYLDTQPVANAKSITINRAKKVDAVKVLGTLDRRIAEGTIDISGALSGIRNSDTMLRLIRSATQTVDMQTLIIATAATSTMAVGTTNLVTNGGFETYTTTPGAPDNWTVAFGAGANIAKETTIKRTGSNAVKFTQPGTPAAQGISQTIAGLTVGKTYFVEAWARTSAAGGSTRGPLLRVTNVTDTVDIDAPRGTIGGTVFQRLTLTFTVLAGKTYAVKVINDDTVIGSIFYYDDVAIQLADSNVGTSNAESVIQTGSLTFTQTFTALGTSLQKFYINASKTNTFVEDVTVVLKNSTGSTLSTYTLPNSQLPVGQDWVEFIVPLSLRINTLVAGQLYSLTFSVGSTAGALSLYGNDIQTQYLVGTGTGAQTTFNLNVGTVASTTLFIATGTITNYLGQLVGYTFSHGTGPGGVDQIIFTAAPANGVAVYAQYEYNFSPNFFALRVGFINPATFSPYSIVIERYDSTGLVLLDRESINNVRFSKQGLSIAAGSFLEETLDFDGESETDTNVNIPV